MFGYWFDCQIYWSSLSAFMAWSTLIVHVCNYVFSHAVSKKNQLNLGSPNFIHMTLMHLQMDWLWVQKLRYQVHITLWVPVCSCSVTTLYWYSLDDVTICCWPRALIVLVFGTVYLLSCWTSLDGVDTSGLWFSVSFYFSQWWKCR